MTQPLSTAAVASAAASPSAPRNGRRTLLAALLAGAVAAVLRAVHLQRAYDLFVDEVTYQRLSAHLADTGRLELYGRPFHLHPPGLFVLEAGLLRLLGGSAHSGDGVHAVLATRRLDVALAALTAALLVVLVRRVARPAAALAAGLAYAADGFLVKATSRNMLEALTVLAAVAAVLVLTAPGRDGRDGRPGGHWLAGGLLCGAALLSNEVAAFLTLLPLGVAAVTGAALRRGAAVRAGAVALATYAVYPLWALLAGQGGAYADQKLHGVLRLVGAVQETGFNTAAGPSLSTAVLDNLGQFGTTYALLGLGVPATVLLLVTGGRTVRWLGTWAASAYALLGYLVVRGTLEEQFFAYLVVPALVAVVVAVDLLLTRLPARAGLVRALAALAVLAFGAASALAWSSTHLTRHDDAYVRVLADVREQVPCGSSIAATETTAQFLLPGYRLSERGTPEAFAAAGDQYVLTASQLVAKGLGTAPASTVVWLREHATVVADEPGRTAGHLVLWRLGPPPAPGGCAAPDGAG